MSPFGMKSWQVSVVYMKWRKDASKRRLNDVGIQPIDEIMVHVVNQKRYSTIRFDYPYPIK